MQSVERRWVRVAQSEALAEGERLAVRVDALRLLLLRREGQVYAVENGCPHLGCAFTRGGFEGYTLTCPCHDWTFDIRNGAFALAPEISVATFPCKVEADALYVQLGGDADGQD